MDSTVTKPTIYASMAVAYRALTEAMPPGAEVPSRAFIRRAAARGQVRTVTVGGTVTQYHLDDVRALVVVGGDA